MPEEEFDKAMINAISNWADKQAHYNDRLKVKDIVKEYHISENMVYKAFKDKNLPVQNWTKPAFVLRGEWDKYFRTRHDYLKDN